MADYQALKSELLAGHPVTGAYSGDDATAAGELNALNIDVNLASISGDETFQATDATEYGALTDTEKQLWLAFCGRDIIDPFATANVTFVTDLFGAATVANLQAIRKKQTSQAALTFGKAVNEGHVAHARSI